MNYEKLTVERFAASLKEGKYKDVTGARRAVGKMASWSDKDKDKGRELAAKHFGVDGAKKPATKATAPKKVAKAVKKAVARVAAKVKKSAVAKSPRVVSDHAGPANAPVRNPSNLLNKAPANPGEAVQIGQQLMTFVAHTHGEMEKSRQYDPTADFTRLENEIRGTMTKAVQLVNTSLGVTPKDNVELPAARVSVPKTPSVKTIVAKPEHKGSPEKAPPAPAPIAAPAATASGKELLPAPASAAQDLSPEEQEKAAALRNAIPAPTASLAGLPRPSVNVD